MVERKESFEYNGWKGNGESRVSARFTWLTALWLSNERFLDEQTRHIANSGEDVRKAGEALKEFVEEFVIGEFLNQPGLVSDLLRSILESEINWVEIVENHREPDGPSDQHP